LQILANENVPEPVVAELRRRGHDVAWIAEIMRGAGDHEVLALAQRQSRLVVTYDKDFGELAFSAHLPARCGVVLLRLSGSSPAVDNARAVEALGSPHEWAGHFTIVEDDRIRCRPLPVS
jgi:predicted nuclease of predicted toxin-antitoxin system